MIRPRKLSLPTTLAFVVVAATAVTPFACGGGSSGGGGNASTGGTAGSTSSSTEMDVEICVPGPDAGTNQKCPDMVPVGTDCPPGCEGEVV